MLLQEAEKEAHQFLKLEELSRNPDKHAATSLIKACQNSQSTSLRRGFCVWQCKKTTRSIFAPG
ncbi:hypothetical protein AV540_00275 [Brevibacillus parabrevis]|uniref:hypothetical protein n=1 Tax=Brevibacillus parabrevis TaxID=54914 RepID=UPI0007ABD2B9|nr:hypothetical protein [Brevibacillus parabrevis]KZE51443.1 hypothetical protein AV540_00275 [Brevibacillus parabrevis]